MKSGLCVSSNYAMLSVWKILIAVLSHKTSNSWAARIADIYAGNTGRKVICICSGIGSLKKARESRDKHIAVEEGEKYEIQKVSVWDADAGNLLSSYTDRDGFSLYGFISDRHKLVGSKGESPMWTWDFFEEKESWGEGGLC